jgi:hypothetical protein
MKYLLAAFILLSSPGYSQQGNCENIFIITTDGYRWQELFNGADSAILFDPEYVKDTATLRYLYWGASVEERRKKLMPFVWNYIEKKGQLWGNRQYGNYVSVANPYRFSYAGYNEIFTGYADPAVISNRQRNNRNSNVLTYLNSLPAYKNKVAMFGSWKLFSYILNGNADKIPLNAGYQDVAEDSLSITEKAVNYIQQTSEYNKLPTRSDLLTFTIAAEYIQKAHPRIVYIGFGETDEFAHHGEYDRYLNQANLIDKFIAELWSLVQGDAFYRDKTSLFITTDHGRGRKPNKWTVHGPLTGGSDETWMVQLGPNIKPLGEMKERASLNNRQFAQTIADYLGEIFVADDHPVAAPVYSFMKGPDK